MGAEGQRRLLDSTVLLLGCYFMLAYVMTASFMAAVGSAVNEMREAQAMMMPIMMLVLFYQFPSGLVLYYMLSNFLGIAHQRWVGRNMTPAGSSG